MKQILLVLRKDCRKFWPEIVLTLAVICAFVWAYPFLWTQRGDFPQTGAHGWLQLDLNRLQMLARTITVLLPVSWLVLIARVVHDENLVGMSQFWITRPYRWDRLLFEKLLFVALFVCVPFTAAQMALLARAGFHPLQFVPGLAYCLLLILITAILPLFCLSAVTSSLLRIIGILLVIVIAIAIAAFLFGNSIDAPSPSVPYSADRLILPMMFAFCAVILVVQYSSRKLWLGRALFGALAVLVWGAASSPFDLAMLERIYQLPAPGKAYPIRALPSATAVDRIAIARTNDKFAYLLIPLDLTGIPNGEAVTVDDIRLTIDAPAGARWTGKWQGMSLRRITPADATNTFEVAVDRSWLDTRKPGPLNLTVNLALTNIAPGASSQIKFTPGQSVEVPKVGVCTQFAGGDGVYGEIDCRVPFHQPALAQISAIESPLPCDAANPIQPGWRLQFTWIGNELSPALSDLGFTSVWTTELRLPYQWYETEKGEKPTQLALCPGTPVTITPFHLVNRFQTETKMTVTSIDSSPSL